MIRCCKHIGIDNLDEWCWKCQELIDASRLDKPNTTENDNENTYVIKEIARFVPASLFVKVEDMREQKLNQLGIV